MMLQLFSNKKSSWGLTFQNGELIEDGGSNHDSEPFLCFFKSFTESWSLDYDLYIKFQSNCRL